MSAAPAASGTVPGVDPLSLTMTLSAATDQSSLPADDKTAVAVPNTAPADPIKTTLTAIDSMEDDDDKSITVSPLTVTLLLISGLRASITIDREYMKGHSLGLREPESLTVLTLKECIWKDWKEEWGERPGSTEYIRLIHFGRLLDNKDSLGASQLSRTNMYNVLHMSIRPASIAGNITTSRGSKHRSSNASNDPTNRQHHHHHRHSNHHHRQPDTSISAHENHDSTTSRSAGCGCVIL
ncbi:hypothetical protein V1525DRAFT_427906 [Lipomyces kononenkoae]|uniref:Uncharacterized protein n=1 Tax=Lipomyces kononenkoae TaxID=34357 RepID=A0ACC3SUR8_LIPKO